MLLTDQKGSVVEDYGCWSRICRRTRVSLMTPAQTQAQALRLPIHHSEGRPGIPAPSGVAYCSFNLCSTQFPCPYGIDGSLDIAANAWSKVLISRTPLRRQLARWQRSRACRLGYCSWSCRARATSASSSGQTSTAALAINSSVASKVCSLPVGRYTWASSCITSAEVHRGAPLRLASTKKRWAGVWSA